jgi:hypothetical protein
MKERKRSRKRMERGRGRRKMMGTEQRKILRRTRGVRAR